MNALLVLILIQLTGIGLSILISCLNLRINKRTILIGKPADYRKSNSNDNWPWLTEYFQNYPLSDLRKLFPEVYKTSLAAKRYKELNFQQEKGIISKRKYEKELKKILPLINVKPDLSAFKKH